MINFITIDYLLLFNYRCNENIDDNESEEIIVL